MARGMKIVEAADPGVIEMRRSLAQRIAAHAEKEGELTTAVPGLILYHRTSPTPCYRASYEPSLSIFVQGRKRINLGGTEYLCDGSSFLLSSIDVPAQSQIIEASEKGRPARRHNLIPPSRLSGRRNDRRVAKRL